MRNFPLFSPILFLLFAFFGNAGVSCKREEMALRIAVTTSMERLELVEQLAEAFTQATSIRVQILALSSGQALESLARGDVSAAFAHAPEMEKKFRRKYPHLKPSVMLHSAFVIAGPLADPAGVRQAVSPADAFARIARAGALFVSRADASGTAEFERKTWQEAGIRPAASRILETGRGAPETLLLAAEKKDYTLTPLATWLQFSNSPSFRYGDYGQLFGNAALMPNPYTLYTSCGGDSAANCRQAQAFSDFLAGKPPDAL
jgi:tungstate transport system substrate-binding protein